MADARPLGLVRRPRKRAHGERQAVRCRAAHCTLQHQGLLNKRKDQIAFKRLSFTQIFKVEPSSSIQYGTPENAADKPDGLAVLGIFIEVGFVILVDLFVMTVSYPR